MHKQLILKDRSECMFDCLSLGEVMLRFDPGESRIHTSRNFTVWEGGGEYNVSRGLRRCFGLKTVVVTALVDNPVGRLLEDCMLQGGVNTDYIFWRQGDPIGKNVRNGLNFTERGYGIRGAIGQSDRANTAASQMKVGDIDWEYIFGELGVRWFHTGGIFAALSKTTAEVVLEAVKVAKKYGTVISYDLNYRPSLWKDNGGEEAAAKINREIVTYLDVLIGNEEDYGACLGFEIPGNDNDFKELDKNGYGKMVLTVQSTFKNLYCVANTLRTVKNASINDWDAILCVGDKVYHTSPFNDLEIFDRVGGGDSFAAGLIYGFLKNFGPEKALAYGVTHGALAMSTPGDTSMANLKEVEGIIRGSSARIVR